MIMKKIILALAAAAALLTACEEFQPVFTGKYPEPEAYTSFDPSTIDADKIISIKELAARYTEKASSETDLTLFSWVVPDELWIHGRVTTSDKYGNFYKSFYIQDEADGPGIEIKIGRTSLYNDYKVGQEVYVNLDGLAVGQYGYKLKSGVEKQGMIQVGLKDGVDYATTYLESQYIIDQHIFRCDVNDLKEVTPREISKDDLLGTVGTQAVNDNVGALVTVKGLKYANEIFCLLYISGNESNKNNNNRVFLSDKTWGVTTWAMSKNNFLHHLTETTDWDSATTGDGRPMSEVKEQLKNNANSYTVSHYFTHSSGTIQLRTSGYSKFADAEIDPDVLSGKKTLSVTGILSMYENSFQISVVSQDDIKVE